MPMHTNYTNRIRILFVFVAVLLFLSGALFAYAQSVFDIEYPIVELGGCADKVACKTYCNDVANQDACITFAKKFGISTEKVERANEARNFVEEQTGPGGCRGANECRTYCDDPNNQEECFSFAKRKGLINDQDVKRFEKGIELQKELQGGGGPGGCKSEGECRAYCENPNNGEECLSFAEKQGLISGEEAQKIKKLGLAGGPGGCKGPTACRNYCDDATHQEECISFAEQNGLMPKEEVERAKKFILNGGPGGCKTQKECQAFCDNPDNAETCINHAEENGLLPPEKLAEAKKFASIAKQGGPGGCRGQKECDAYCSDPTREEECFNFADKNGLLRPEDRENIEVGRKLKSQLQTTGGPGGCKSEGECRAYCGEGAHVEECVAFAATQGGVSLEKAKGMLQQFQQNRFGPQGPESFGPGQFGPQNFGPQGPEGFGPGGPGFGGEGGQFGPPPGFEKEFEERFSKFKQFEEQFKSGQFPGMPGQFPGAPGQFPGGPGQGSEQFGKPGEQQSQGLSPGSNEFLKQIQEKREFMEKNFQQGFPQGQIPEGFQPPQGSGSGQGGFPQPGQYPSPEQFRDQYQQQYQQQFQQQYNQQQPQQNFQPSGGSFEQQFQQPQEFQSAPQPSGRLEEEKTSTGTLLDKIKNLFSKARRRGPPFR